MIEHNNQNNQLPKELKSVFHELEISQQHLRNAGIKKRIGFTYTYLFQLVFRLIFDHKSWFNLLIREIVIQLKTLISFHESKSYTHTDSDSLKVMIIDIPCAIEIGVKKLSYCPLYGSFLLEIRASIKNSACFFELVKCFYFYAFDFFLLSSKNSQINGISENIDKHSSGNKRRV